MGKLNYTNRKISGEKLGAAVKRDILKCIVQAAKPTRMPKDPHIELNLQGKYLCDRGLELACEGLTTTLESGSAKLDELNLSENKITLTGLKYLERVIRLASRDLKDLDLRCNDIQICTDEDAEIWGSFLTGFRDVCILRRLDISENPLGDRGVEVFLSVYVRESPVILPRAVRPTLAESSDEEYDTEFEADSDIDVILSSELQPIGLSSHRDLSESPPSLHSIAPKSTKPYITDLSLGRRSSSFSLSMPLASGNVDIQGLRSIPYLIFSKTTLSDKAALFLSYILPIHPTPERLLRYFPPVHPGVQVEIFGRYDKISGCSGIIYQNNEQFTSMGLKVLELAESIREMSSPPTSALASPRSRQVSDTSNGPLTPLKSRRESLSSPSTIHSPQSSFGSGTELERARSKIQGVILKESGPGAVGIWITALKMLAVSRTILFDKEDLGTEYFSLCARTSHYHSPSRPMFATFNSTSSGFHVGSLNFPHTAQFQQHHPHILDGPGAWNGPNISQTGSHISPRDASDCPSSYSSSTKTAELEEPQEKKPKELLGNLPENIWIRIIALVTDPKDILSERQRKNIVAWARTSESLERERELAGKLKSVQIWRLLEGLECLVCEFKIGRDGQANASILTSRST